MNRLLIGTTLALATAFACGGDDSTINPPPGDDSGPDTSMGGGDSSPGQDSGGQDSGPGTDSSVPDAATFNVGAVPGLALWLNGSKDVTVVSGHVTKWHDQSGNNNDATSPNFTAAQPTPVASSVNGEPAVHFTATATGADGGLLPNTGNQMNIADSTSLDWGTGDYLIEAVGLYDNTTKSGNPDEERIGAGTFYSKQGYSSGGSTFDVTTGPALYGNVYSLSAPTTGYSGYADQSNFLASAATGYNDGKGHLFAVQRVGTTLSLRLNGVQTDTKSIGSVDVDVKINARIGASGDANIYRLNGDIDEIIAVKGTITSSDQATIEGYLKAKYGL